jgi:hypothetical protein
LFGKIDPTLLLKLQTAGPTDKFVVWTGFSDRPALDNNPWDALPSIHLPYLDEVKSIPDAKFRFIDELRNEISVEASAQAIFEIASLSFISRIDEVSPLAFLSHSYGSVGSTRDMDTIMDSIDVRLLHHANYDGTGIRIAFLDSGVDLSHPALARFADPASGFVWRDLANGRTDPYDDHPNKHGTGVAALALGFDTTWGYKGSGYDASLMAVKICASTIACFMDSLVEGIKFAVSNGARIISASVGTRTDDLGNCMTTNGSSPAAIWTGWAVSQGVTVVVAAGNEGEETDCAGIQIGTPADNFNAITVGATNLQGTVLWELSSKGPTQDGRRKPDVVAPGQDVPVACVGSCPGGIPYVRASGTSFSTPLVAGALASIMEKRGSWSPARLKAVLRDTAFDIGSNGVENSHGFGLVQASRASDDLGVPMLLAWDAAFTVQTSFASFKVWDSVDSSSPGRLQLEVMKFHGKLIVGSYFVPWVEYGGSGWRPLDNSILFAGPYVSESTATTLGFSAVYGDSITRLTLSVRLTEITSTRVQFDSRLDFIVAQGSSAVNARIYLDFEIEGNGLPTACCDYFERISDAFRYSTETRIEATNIRVKDTDTSVSRLADIYFNSADNGPYEWLLRAVAPDADPDYSLNGENINGANILFEYQSRRGVQQTGSIGPTIYVNTPASGGGGCGCNPLRPSS